jgi:hypothetical protein
LSVIAHLLKAGWRASGLVLPVVIMATAAALPVCAQPSVDRQQELNLALDHYATLKNPGQRAAVLEYLRQLDHKVVAGAVIDHILAARNGSEATAFNRLITDIAPEGCSALVERLGSEKGPVEKGKLIVAMRHCEGDECIHALAGCLGDGRAVPFEAHTATPRRVCDLAYDELYLKLRSDPRYGLDPTGHMAGIITEKTPVKARDALIAKLKTALAAQPSGPAPVATPTPSPSPGPETAKPATAAIS